jgi:nucleoredoxin
MEQLFESSDLLGKDGSTVKASSLASFDVVGLYFSAHWCPPCRAFTPKAGETYKQAKKDGKSFEVVFVSSDKDQSQFDEYFETMPWLALPYDKRDLKSKLSKKFKVSGIPMLVLLDGKTGKVISKDGRAALMKDPKAELFPWTPPTIKSAIGPTLVKNDGTEVDAQTLNGKYTALYFSASWCGPCKNFTPKLIEAYNKVKETRDDFEVVFVSADRDQKAFDSYFGKMPWLSLPYSERGRESDLNELFSVEGIPHLVMVDPNGKIINKDMVGNVAADFQKCENFPWKPKPVNEIEEAGGALNDTPSIIVFGDAKGALEAPAKEYMDRVDAGEEEDEMMFCQARESGAGTIGGQVRKLCGLPAASGTPDMVLLDISDDGGYYVHEGEVTEQSVRDFLAGYKAKKLTRKQLSH